MGAANEKIKQVTRWLGFISAVLSVTAGIVNIVHIAAHISWPSGGFVDDVNASSWRSVITLQPTAIGEATSCLLLNPDLI